MEKSTESGEQRRQYARDGTFLQYASFPERPRYALELVKWEEDDEDLKCHRCETGTKKGKVGTYRSWVDKDNAEVCLHCIPVVLKTPCYDD